MWNKTQHIYLFLTCSACFATDQQPRGDSTVNVPDSDGKFFSSQHYSFFLAGE